MIIYHQNNVAAFAGNHVVYWVGQPLLGYRISDTSSAGISLVVLDQGMLTGGLGTLLGGL